MKTIHKIFNENSNNMNALEDNSVHLVVTSPPYPMISMWDEMFGDMNPKITTVLSTDPTLAFELMHQELDKVWTELYRVVDNGCFVCINIGDATRTTNGVFQIFMNSARIINKMTTLGFVALPQILWRKPTNAPNKYMGSGMFPAGAYVTLEHEHILIFRKGGKRVFNKDEIINRRKSGFFWEERNLWFSDLWEFRGTSQKSVKGESRDRTAAYPMELPLRLINMYSTYGDIVLDPFLGTGTTSLASAVLGRNSIGYEIDSSFLNSFNDMITKSISYGEKYWNSRLNAHITFTNDYKKEFKYTNDKLSVPVVTSQEVNIEFRIPNSYEFNNKDIIIKYKPLENI